MASRLAVFLLLVLAAFLGGCSTLKPRLQSFRIGETIVPVRVQQRDHPTPIMVNVHDDENTSVRAGKAVLRESGGQLIELAHSGQRHVAFQLQGETYRFDPNRIFTDAGIRSTLTRQGKYSEAAQAAVRQFASEFIEAYALNRQPVIIALHNTDGRGLSINSYQTNRPLNSAAARVHESTSRSPGDFFYVTDERFFSWLKSHDFNVLLQDNANVPDDGSMSVYFARLGIPYLNIEAHNDHLQEQIEMVRAAQEMLANLGLSPKDR